MDTTASLEYKKAVVAEKIANMKKEMKLTCAWIARATKNNKQAYAQVLAGLSGEPGCFYARELVVAQGQLDRWIEVGCFDGLNAPPDDVYRGFDWQIAVVLYLPSKAAEVAAVQALAPVTMIGEVVDHAH